jgi:hypothetical protein
MSVAPFWSSTRVLPEDFQRAARTAVFSADSLPCRTVPARTASDSALCVAWSASERFSASVTTELRCTATSAARAATHVASSVVAEIAALLLEERHATTATGGNSRIHPSPDGAIFEIDVF